MVRLGMALNRDTWNAVSFVSRKKNDRENGGREQYSDSIPGSKPERVIRVRVCLSEASAIAL